MGRPVVKANRLIEEDIVRGLESFACKGGPLKRSMWVDFGVLLELARRAKLGLLTKAGLTPEPCLQAPTLSRNRLR